MAQEERREHGSQRVGHDYRSERVRTNEEQSLAKYVRQKG